MGLTINVGRDSLNLVIFSESRRCPENKSPSSSLSPRLPSPPQAVPRLLNSRQLVKLEYEIQQSPVIRGTLQNVPAVQVTTLKPLTVAGR